MEAHAIEQRAMVLKMRIAKLLKSLLRRCGERRFGLRRLIRAVPAWAFVETVETGADGENQQRAIGMFDDQPLILACDRSARRLNPQSRFKKCPAAIDIFAVHDFFRARAKLAIAV